MRADKHDRLSGIARRALLLAVPLGVVSLVLFLVAARGNLRTLMIEPEALLTAGSPAVLRWASVTDMLGYYLLQVPFILAVRVALRERAPKAVDTFTAAGVLYVIVGAAAAAVFAVAAPTIIESYTTRPRAATAADFERLIDVAWRGMWQTLNPILAAMFWIGMGALLGTATRSGRLSVTTGAFALVVLAGRIATIDGMVVAGLAGFLVLPLLVPLVLVGTRFEQARTP